MYQQIEKKVLELLKQKKKPACISIESEEDFFLERLWGKIKGPVFKNNGQSYNGSETDGVALLENLQSLDLFSSGGLFASESSLDDRFLLLRQGASLKKSEVILEALQASKENPWDPSVLVFLGDTDGRKKLFSHIKKQGCHFEIAKPRPEEVSFWIKEILKEAELDVDSKVVSLLQVLASDTLLKVKTEIEKLKVYHGESKDPLSLQEAEAVVSGAVKFEMAELVKSVIDGMKARSLIVSTHTVKTAEDALGFVGFLTWAVKNPDKFKVQKKPTLERLKRLSRSLLDLDEDLKSTGIEPRILVDRFIVENTF